jgi:NADPH2:quinone reductase
MMRALVCEAYGPVENLKIAELPMPEPKAGEILMRVGAAGVSFAALLGMQGKHQNKPALPYVPGNEMAGHVVKLGPGVTNLAVGQRVTTGVSQGAYAEYAVAAAANAVPIPETMPYAQATNFPTLYPTAYGALKWKADMQPGEVLLVHGAGGGSGLTAIEVGKAMGAIVIASAGGAEKLAAARDAGADHLIDYRTEDLRARVLELTDGRGADVVYDPVGGDTYARSTKCIAFEGRILIIGFAGGQIQSAALNHALVKNYSIVGLHWGLYQSKNPQLIKDCHAQLTKMVADGAIRPLVSERLGLDEVPAGVQRLADGGTVGRVVFVP